jgi:hypothetical protein
VLGKERLAMAISNAGALRHHECKLARKKRSILGSLLARNEVVLIQELHGSDVDNKSLDHLLRHTHVAFASASASRGSVVMICISKSLNG